MMGTGPLIIPEVFLKAGVIFSTIWLLFASFLSWICADMVIETLGICNALTSKELQEGSS
jgi:amino acid permease